MSGFYELIKSEEGLPLKVFLHSVNKLNMHWHKELEILLVLKGSINLRIGKELYTLRENDLAMINRNQTHNTSRTREGNIVLALQINPDYFAKFHPQIYDIKFCCNSIIYEEENRETYDIIRSFLAKIVWEINKKRNGYRLMVGSELNQLMSHIINNCDNVIMEDPRSAITNDDMERLESILGYINENMEEKITLQQLADREHISLYYLSHFFKDKLGLTFQEYINSIRVDKATSLLITTNDNITNIALQCGFSSTTYFNRLFKEVHGYTPSEYRDKNMTPDRVGQMIDIDKIRDKTYLDIDRSQAFRKLFSYLNHETDNKNDIYLMGTTREEISIDIDDTKGEDYVPYWKKLTTFGRAAEGLRAEVQRQLRELQSQIGFEYVRFHGIFNDEMMIYNMDTQGNISYNWTYVDQLFDFFMEIGIKPFVELAFMPSKLGRTEDTTIFYWKGNISPPRDIKLWTDLVQEFIRHCIERYGFEEVETWYFEVWNEPEYRYTFWAGTREEYFQFYKDTSIAIKSISKDLKVGGPAVTHATATCSNWMEEFLIYCKSENVPLDFVSIHIYPEYIPQETVAELYKRYTKDESIPEPRDIRRIYHEKDHTMNTIQQLNEIIDKNLDYKPETHITEWNASSFLGNLIHDTVYVSTFIVKDILQNIGRVDSLGYWVFTDIFEEQNIGVDHFHGGFGLINKDGLKKPSYYAYHLLNKLGREIIEQGEDYIITRQGEDIQILAYNYAYFDNLFLKGDISALDNKRRYEVYEEKLTREIGINIRGLSGKYKLTRHELNREHGSVFDEWIKMGAPEKMSKEEIEYIDGISRPKITIEYIDIEGEYRNTIYIPVHGVELIELKKKI